MNVSLMPPSVLTLSAGPGHGRVGIAIQYAICFDCRKYPGTTIVTDSVTSNGLTTFIEQLGGKHFR